MGVDRERQRERETETDRQTEIGTETDFFLKEGGGKDGNLNPQSPTPSSAVGWGPSRQ